MRDETVDLDSHLRAEELRRLVKDAFEGLNTRDREVLELAMRQDLEGKELAAALGLSLNHTHALLSRARQQLEKALAAVIVARNGRRDCPELAQMLEAWDGTMTILMRKRINRHTDECEICAERRHHDVSAASLLTLVPVPVLSSAFRDQVIEVVTGPEHAEHRREVTERAGRFDQNGFPVPIDRWVRRMSPTPVKMAAAGAAGVGILVAGPFLWASEGPGGPPEHHPGPQVTRIAPGGTVPQGVRLKPGDIVNGRTLGPGETYGPGDKVPLHAPAGSPHRGSKPPEKPSDGSSPRGMPGAVRASRSERGPVSAMTPSRMRTAPSVRWAPRGPVSTWPAEISASMKRSFCCRDQPRRSGAVVCRASESTVSWRTSSSRLSPLGSATGTAWVDATSPAAWSRSAARSRRAATCGVS